MYKHLHLGHGVLLRHTVRFLSTRCGQITEIFHKKVHEKYSYVCILKIDNRAMPLYLMVDLIYVFGYLFDQLRIFIAFRSLLSLFIVFHRSLFIHLHVFVYISQPFRIFQTTFMGMRGY